MLYIVLFVFVPLKENGVRQQGEGARGPRHPDRDLQHLLLFYIFHIIVLIADLIIVERAITGNIGGAVSIVVDAIERFVDLSADREEVEV